MCVTQFYVGLSKFLLTFNGSHAWAIIKPNWQFYTTLNDWRDDRRQVQSSRCTSSIPERTRYSILFKYYIKGVKTFDRL